jgi:hypothetical protein
LFPSAGSSLGGTELVIDGASFDPGLQVRIDGVAQPQTTVESSTRLRVTTEAGVAGGPYVVEVENPDGEIATSAFSYSTSLDPAISAVAPAKGTHRGGTSVTISGSNFDASSTVVFGADPATGLGGSAAASVALVDSSTLVATTPSHAQGPVSVMVLDLASGQASVLDASFVFQGDAPSAGGGCSTRSAGDSIDPRAAASSVAPLALVLAILAARALLARRRLHAA